MWRGETPATRRGGGGGGAGGGGGERKFKRTGRFGGKVGYSVHHEVRCVSVCVCVPQLD